MEEKKDWRRRPMEEKTKLKISLAKKGIRSSPNTEFKKGQVSWCAVNGNPKCREENNNNWQGGTSRGYARRILFQSGKDLTHCQVCNIEGNLGKKGKLVVHHLDHNRNNNNIDNLIIACYQCHNNVLHSAGYKTQFKKVKMGK